MRCHSGKGSSDGQAKGFFHRWMKRRMANRVNRVATKLELNADQQEELAALLNTFGETRKALFSSRWSLQSDVTRMLRSSEEETGWLADQVKESLGEIKTQADVAVEKLSTFVVTLSAEQRSKLADMLDRRRPCGC